MLVQEIKIGDVVRHRTILRGSDLAVVEIDGDKVVVRYANQGLFHTQELFLSEVELVEIDEDEYL
jgi:hypothetical protein